ncbi:hypothetical protein, partial [Pseudomonas sp. GW460-R15]|uniref:hypothetical protein n=1 Tax=Pseudomonas sp. GW460-R15 TaxID=2075557 RepID=UPI001C451EE8
CCTEWRLPFQPSEKDAMKALVLEKAHEITLRDVELPLHVGPRDVKIVKYSKRGGQRPEIKTLRVLGNQRLTPGGTIKRAKAKRPLSAKKRNQAD